MKIKHIKATLEPYRFSPHSDVVSLCIEIFTRVGDHFLVEREMEESDITANLDVYIRYLVEAIKDVMLGKEHTP